MAGKRKGPKPTVQGRPTTIWVSQQTVERINEHFGKSLQQLSMEGKLQTILDFLDTAINFDINKQNAKRCEEPVGIKLIDDEQEKKNLISQ